MNTPPRDHPLRGGGTRGRHVPKRRTPAPLTGSGPAIAREMLSGSLGPLRSCCVLRR
jgi:hypothetical protein